jgi:ornithine--oxo-acid transaminase
LEVLKSEKMAENAEAMGKLLRAELEKLNSPLIKLVRGRGLLNAIVIDHKDPEVSWELCLHLKDLGLLAKPTHGDKIRFAPPLIITETQIKDAVGIIDEALKRLS